MNRKASPAPKPKSLRKEGLERWNELNAARNGFLRRLQGFASVTLPVVFLPDGVDQNSSSIQYDWSSVGAQAVNNLANRFALNLFRPGIPFFRLDLGRETERQLLEEGVKEADLREVMVNAEQQGMRAMDREALRPRIVSAFEQLIILGNTLMNTEDELEFINLKDYVVRRALSGKPVEILTNFSLLYDELEDDIASKIKSKRADETVQYVRHYVKAGKEWTLKQYVDNQYVPDGDQTWTEKAFPLHPLTWRLAKNQNYGTGLVEDYAGDFSTLSNLSESEVKLALLMSDYRWLVAPESGTNIADFKRSRTGEAIMGRQQDVQISSAGQMGQNLQYVSASVDKVIRRIGAGFLLGTAVTRDAERVTAEEMRQQAQELEVALGGAYSRLAADMQTPIVVYLMDKVDVKVDGKEIEPTIVTGMDALSRNAEAQQLSAFLQQVSQLNGIPDDVRARMHLGEILSIMASSSGLVSAKLVLSDEQAAEKAKQEQEQAIQQSAQQGVIDGGSKAIAKGAPQ